MGRVFFPTYRANVIGVRDVGPQTVLRGVIPVPRAPAEPYPRPSNNPTGRMLGAAMIMANGGGPVLPGSPRVWNFGFPDAPPVAPVDSVGIRPILVTSAPDLPVTAAPGAPPSATPPPAAPPVSVQTSPTPVVSVPQQPAGPTPIYISSGGGTPAPATAPITIQTGGGDVTSGVAAWLKGSTVIFSYSVPNALLAFAAVLGFAYLSSGSGGKRR